MLLKIAFFLRLVNDPPNLVSGFLLRRREMKEFMFWSFICLGNFNGFLMISW